MHVVFSILFSYISNIIVPFNLKIILKVWKNTKHKIRNMLFDDLDLYLYSFNTKFYKNVELVLIYSELKYH